MAKQTDLNGTTADIHRDLVDLCKKGDRVAQYRLYKLYSQAMYNICRRMVSDEQEAQDLLQESFIKAFNKLESYIEKNRERLDVETPDDELIWQHISSRLDARKKQTGWLWKAAAIFLIFLTVGSVTIYSVNQSVQQQQPGISLNDISKELADEEKAFRLMVYQKMDQVKASNINPGLSYELYKELHQIDLQYDSYFADMQELGDNPKVIRGLIRCYEQKLKILEKTIREIEKNEHYENNKK